MFSLLLLRSIKANIFDAIPTSEKYRDGKYNLVSSPQILLSSRISMQALEMVSKGISSRWLCSRISFT